MTRVFIFPLPGSASKRHCDSMISMRTAASVTGTVSVRTEWQVAVSVASR